MDPHFLEELLEELLDCRHDQLERLEEVFKIAEKFNVTAHDVVNSAPWGRRIYFEDVMRTAMRLVLETIAEEVEEKEPEVAEALRFWKTSQERFDIEPLDSGMGKTKDELIKETVEYVKAVIRE